MAGARRSPSTRAERAVPTLPLAPPAGMADLLPPRASARRRLSRLLMEAFGAYGFERVTTPPFEHADVLERGLDSVDRRDLLRFVEPESGEVALLRPDITPQIARIVATRLRHLPPPFRLAYEGTVVRRRRLRARRQRQIHQAGVELIGLRGPDSDAEVIEVAADACRRAGLEGFRIELGQVRLAQIALDEIPENLRNAASDALAHKDGARLDAMIAAGAAPRKAGRSLRALVDLYGGVDVVEKARRRFSGRDAAAALAELERVIDRLGRAGLNAQLGVDLGEVRGQAYYTGVSFTILANGPGEPIAAGGRYDQLLERFGMPSPATGFALDVDHLEWALESAGKPFDPERPTRVLAAVGAKGTLDGVANALRNAGVSVARAERGIDTNAAIEYARAWGYDAVVIEADGRTKAIRVRDGKARAVRPERGEDLATLAKWARAGSEVRRR